MDTNPVHSSVAQGDIFPAMPNLHVVIMAGGGGTRFWPLSTNARPKQFLDVLGCGRTLLQMAYDRARILVDPSRIWVITAGDYIPTVQEQLPDLSPARIVGEPVKRNTAPCLALAANLIEHHAEGQLMLAMPSDHIIVDTHLFQRAVLSLYELLSREEALCAIGVQPTRAETGYGYIEVDQWDADPHAAPQPVVAFHEKPDRERAQVYLETGRHAWNTGIFLWPCAHFLSELDRFAPHIVRPFHRLRFDAQALPLDEQLMGIYSELEPLSIDYALLEKPTKRYAVIAPIQWSDLGSWHSLAQYAEVDEVGNTKNPNVVIRQSSNCYVHAVPDRVVVIQGLHGYAVVDTPKALMVCPIGDDRIMRQIQDALTERGLGDYL